MNVFKALKKNTHTQDSTGVFSREMLPAVDGFADVAIGNSRERRSIPIESFAVDTFSTRIVPGLRVGDTADFLYTTQVGRFRFTTTCVRLDDRHSYFLTPDDVKTIDMYGGKRHWTRIESTLPVQWRYAPGGVGNGAYLKGAMTDVSRGGVSLVVAHDVKCGAHVELRFSLKKVADPMVLLGEVVRSTKVSSSGKNSAAVRFDIVHDASADAIEDFVAERQKMRRERGVI